MKRLQQILALLESPDGLSNEEIGDLEQELLSIYDEIVAGESDPTPEDFLNLTEIADACDALRGLAQERIAADEAAAEAAAQEEAARQEALDALNRRVHGEPEPEPVADPVAADPEVPVAEPEPVADPVAADPVAADPPIDDPAGGEPAPEPALVTAAAPATTAPTTPARPAASGQPTGRFAPRPKARQGVTIRQAGTRNEIADRADVDDMLLQTFDDIQDVPAQFNGKHRVAKFEGVWPTSHTLPEGRVSNVTEMALEVQAAAMRGDTDSLVADGGLCQNSENWYGLTTISQAGRPLRGSVTSYLARRGGIVWQTPIKIADISVDGGSGSTTAAIGSMTAADDEAAATNKSYQSMPCGTDVEVTVDMVWRQLKFGVLQSRTNPERVSQFTDQSIAAFARYTEQRLWTKMLALCTHLDGPQALGAYRDLIPALNRMAINYRAYHRMAPNATLEVRLPIWVGLGLLPNDMFKALQSYPEQFQVGIADVEARFRERNIVVAAWYEDDWTTAPSNGGGINAFPTTFHVVMNHPGAFVIVDNGGLDIGIFRDGTMVNDNVFRTFAEEFWNLGMWGVDAWEAAFSLCSNGASAGSIAPKCGS